MDLLLPALAFCAACIGAGSLYALLSLAGLFNSASAWLDKDAKRQRPTPIDLSTADERRYLFEDLNP